MPDGPTGSAMPTYSNINGLDGRWQTSSASVRVAHTALAKVRQVIGYAKPVAGR